MRGGGSDSSDLEVARHEELFRTHHRTVVAYLSRRGSAEDAQDLAAEVFLDAWRQRDQVEVHGDSGWLPWLFTVARRKARDHAESRAAASAREQRAGAPPDVEDFADRVAAVDAAQQEVTVTLAAMARLREDDREVLELCGVFGFTSAQAGITLGIPAGTVRVRLHRARRRLAEAIEEESS